MQPGYTTGKIKWLCREPNPRPSGIYMKFVVIVSKEKLPATLDGFTHFDTTIRKYEQMFSNAKPV
jgi:hypothetical protein